eukprot:4267444-Prorocentrum_lima.AAC.1
MTSSLVGSEMCIRDRLSSCHHGRCHPTQYQYGLPAAEVIPVPEMEETVSYTHLTLPTICSV